MGAFSTYYANKVVDATLRGTTFTPPSTVYFALFTAATGLATDAPTSEVSTSGTGYAREAVTMSAPTAGVTHPTADVEFNEATSDWGTITHGAFMDAPTGGHVIYWAAPINGSKLIETGDTYRSKASNFTVTVS